MLFKTVTRLAVLPAALLLGASLLGIGIGGPTQAVPQAIQSRSNQPGATIIITGDPGGSVQARYNEIAEINRLGQRVEIRRGDCVSSCTMFLGADNVCVSPRAVFAFHGPYRLSKKLSPAEFDHWSNLIAAHFPDALRQWYMNTARHKIYSVTRLSGAEVIRKGVPRCH